VGCNACACYHFFDHLDLLWGYFFCHNKNLLYTILFFLAETVSLPAMSAWPTGGCPRGQMLRNLLRDI
ncbi:hypothetical protein, partial [[Clostridium] symbiosum]|uniref:hypothetical protein n=1 Tax=Clostridium symbiosum TaxID=1512 RepID=UPI001D078C2D